MPKRTVPAASGAMPASGPSCGSRSGKRTRPTYIGHRLDGMSLDDLDALLDPFLFAMDALLAIYNQLQVGLDDGGGEKGAAARPTNARPSSRRKFASPGGSAGVWAGARSRDRSEQAH